MVLTGDIEPELSPGDLLMPGNGDIEEQKASGKGSLLWWLKRQHLKCKYKVVCREGLFSQCQT